MKREIWYQGSALAAGALLAVAVIVSTPHLIDPDGRLRAAEQKRQERLAVVRQLLKEVKAAEEAGGSIRQEVDGGVSLQ